MERERARFAIEAEVSDLSHAELCRRYGISRPTGYKWIKRYQDQGLEGLRDRSHRPRSCPHATSDLVVERILQLRRRYDWGSRKIRRKLRDDPGIDDVPSPYTITRVLRRQDRRRIEGDAPFWQLVRSIGFTIADGIDGPFELTVGPIALR